MMAKERYPEDLSLSLNDFQESGWMESIADLETEEYALMYGAFAKSAQKAMDDGETAKGKVLWLLSDACSMMLSPENINEPFKPYFQSVDGRRSRIADDFSDTDIEFFSDLLEQIDHARLRARIAEILWLRNKSGNERERYGTIAIEAYRKIEYNEGRWSTDARDCVHRSIVLAKLMKKDEHLESIKLSLLDRVLSIDQRHVRFVLEVSDLLYSVKMGGTHAEQIALNLESLAKEAGDDPAGSSKRALYAGAERWYSVTENSTKVNEMRVAVGESWMKAATMMAKNAHPNNMMALSCAENAIQIFRSIPNRGMSRF